MILSVHIAVTDPAECIALFSSIEAQLLTGDPGPSLSIQVFEARAELLYQSFGIFLKPPRDWLLLVNMGIVLQAPPIEFEQDRQQIEPFSRRCVEVLLPVLRVCGLGNDAKPLQMVQAIRQNIG